MDVENYKRLGLDKQFPTGAMVNGRSNFELADALAVPEDLQYNPCAEAFPADDIPHGEQKTVVDWADAGAFPHTFRDISFYVPVDAVDSPGLPVMVFNDGLAYSDSRGPVRATNVLDVLIHRGEIPAMVAIFVMPGRIARTDPDVVQKEIDPQDINPRDIEQRSFEYDSLTSQYGEFLINEILPLAEKVTGVSLTKDANLRAIGGISSGGICAFNTAWHFPESFTRVLSHCGSFTNIRGGHNYPYLVRSTSRKPIRAFLTSGKKDGNITYGSWPLANKQMAAALKYAGYDFRFEYGEGGHSLCHGGALFAESMRWLWRS